MPQVPYKPIPDTAPKERGAPTLRSGAATPEAFGAGIGAATTEFGEREAAYGGAVSRLGRSQIETGQTEAMVGRAKREVGEALGGLGEKLGQSANAFQQLNNETWAKDRDVEVMVQIGQAKAQFDQLEGQNAIAALPAFQEKIKAIREAALAQAPNPMAKQMLDNSIARRVGFAIVDAGGRAGTQAKAAADRASKARSDTLIDNFSLDDPNKAQWDLKGIADEARANAEHRGDTRDTVQRDVYERQSRAVLNGIREEAIKDPDRARAHFEQYKKHMTEKERTEAETAVMRGEAALGSRIDADRLLRGEEVAGVKVEPFDPSAGPGQLQKFQEAANQIGRTKGANNQYYADQLDTRVRAKVNLGLSGYRDTQNGNLLDLESFVLGSGPNAKLVDMDAINGPNADPKVAAQYNSLDAKGKRAIQNFVAKANKNIPYTAEGQKRFNELMGMSSTDPEGFQQLSLLDEDLPRQKIDQLMSRKRQLLDRKPMMPSILSAARTIAGEAGIAPAKDDASKTAQWNEFVGGMEVASDRYREEHGKPPDYKASRELARGLLKEVVTAPGTFWNTYERRFEVKVPDDEIENIKRAYRAVHGRDPTDSEARVEYLGMKKFPEKQR